MLYENIEQLVNYGIDKNLLSEEDRIYVRNLLLDEFKENNFEECELNGTKELEEILAELLKEAVARGIIEDNQTAKDLFDTRLMNCLMPRPSEVIKVFNEKYKESPEIATDYYYNLSKNSDYIRTYRVKRDRKWKVDSEYGEIDITINLSKPEKSPEEIKAAALAKSGNYPKCLLCKENEGYAGNIKHPARNNHRIIPVKINDTDWGFQYSPYVYYNEHCIVFAGTHTPMKIERNTFVKLFDFVKQFPHYFVGSNADLPIVGGSILSHDHFQGGRYTFAMEKAPVEKEVVIKGFEEVKCGIVKWPVSVLRISSKDTDRLIELADHILKSWREYTDEDAFIFANTNGEAHNTITPIARKRGEFFELDLALRNNITTNEHPLGYFHPHEEFHHVKKENIGLIEVMGLAVLPARLKNEMEILADYIVSGKDIKENELISKHSEWVNGFLPKYTITRDNVMEVLEKEIGILFVGILENTGVFKCDEKGRAAFVKFTESL